MGIKKRFKLSTPKKSYARVLGELDVTMYYSAIAGGTPNVIPRAKAPQAEQIKAVVMRQYIRKYTTADQRQRMQLWLMDSIERAKQRLLEARIRLIPASIPVATEIQTPMHLVEDESIEHDSMRIAA
jgi:hypothetical protein